MRRFITTSLLAVIALPMLACYWADNHNYYLFSVYERTEFSNRMDEITRNNWKAYLGQNDDSYFFFFCLRIDKWFMNRLANTFHLEFVESLISSEFREVDIVAF